MTLSSVLAKNTTYLTISSIAQKALAFWWFTYVAAQLGEDTLGKYTFAVTYTSIFVILMNFGLIPVLTREGAKDPTKLQEYFTSVLSIKIILTVISTVVLLGVFHGLNYFKPMPDYTVLLVYLAIGIIVFDTFRSIIFAVLRAQQMMQYEAIGQFFYQVIVVVAGLIFFRLGFKAGGLIVAINLASVLYLVYSLVILFKKTTIRLAWQWRWPTLRRLLLVAAPFALADIFFKLNGSIDTVMLEYLAGDRYVAWYTIALKLTVTLTVIPGAFATAFFPAMSQALTQSREALRDIFEQSTILLIVISAPIAVGTTILAPSIIHLGFAGFPAAIPALQWFMAGLIFLFVNYPIGNVLNAANRQLLNTVNMGIALVVNIILNVLLVPQYTYLGAPAAAVGSTIALVGLGLPHVYQMTSFRFGLLLKKLLLAMCSAGVMGGAVWLVQSFLTMTGWLFVLTMLGAMVVYGATLIVTRTITAPEIRHVWTAIRRS
ncbi:MAG: lipopolysaccharide O-side chain biosynthesis protein (O-antigen transporter) [uncultured bacterium]|nr:MAG: lipopolysaccharide O-side chain biosynthesis protein (O-antigen transporter) [uncultured bacterium]